MKPTITLTHEEFAATLILCGYEHLSTDLITSFNLTSKDMTARYIEGTERSMGMKGYLNSTRSTGLEEGLEQTIHLLIQSKRKVRFAQGNSVRFIHQIAKQKALIQEIQNGEHRFSFWEMEQGFYTLLEEWLNNDRKVLVTDQELTQIEMTPEDLERFNQLNEKIVENALSGESIHPSIQQFISDLFQNENAFDNLSFLHSSYARDEMVAETVIFFLINKNAIWLLDYNEVEEDKLTVNPIDKFIFLSNIEKDLLHYMTV